MDTKKILCRKTFVKSPSFCYYFIILYLISDSNWRTEKESKQVQYKWNGYSVGSNMWRDFINAHDAGPMPTPQPAEPRAHCDVLPK